MFKTNLFFLILFLGIVFAKVSIWETIQITNQNPIQDYGGHSSVAVGSIIYEFGGLKENRSLPVSSSIITLYSTLRALNTTTNTWSLVNSSNGIEPPPRGWLSMAVLGESIYIFGGVSYNFQALGDFWEFNLNTKQWINRTLANGPAARSGPALTAYDGKLLLTGGLNPWTLQGYGDLWSYNPATQQWIQVNTTGVTPVGRALIETAIYKNYLYVFGGEGFEPSRNYFGYSKQMYRIHLRTLVWEEVTPVIPLSSIRLHYATVVFDDMWHFHGGDFGNCPPLDLLVQSTSVYDFKKNVWYEGYLPTYEEGVISKRAKFACVDDVCYHTGGYTGIRCDNTELKYINTVSTYRPDNSFVHLARSRLN